MICKLYASKILNTLTGVSSSSSDIISAPSTVYLGLCATEPNATTGVVTSAGEPTSVASYARKQVSGTSASIKSFGVSSSTGLIQNTVEIQMKTAKENYPEKINYWFLSTASSGAAFMWGKIKRVICESMSVDNFVSADNGYTATATCEDSLELTAGETYIVKWDGVEYEVKAVQDSNAIRLGNSDEKSFNIVCSESVVDGATVGRMEITSVEEDSSHTVAIYGIGIEIKKDTVPTFYEGELKASIDV